MNGQKIGMDNWKQQRETSTFSSPITQQFSGIENLSMHQVVKLPLIKNAIINGIDDAGSAVSN
jgi:hypothetical protein